MTTNDDRESKAREILADIRRLETSIGRFPTRDQYLDDPGARFNAEDIAAAFGTWTKMLLIEGAQPRVKKRNKQELRKRSYEHLLKEIDLFRTTIVEHKPSISLLAIGDLHAPYMHQDYPDFLIGLNREYGCDRVVCVGDEVDFHAINFHDHDPDILSPGHELDAARKQLDPIFNAFDQVDVAESNHGSMVYRKGKHYGLPRQVLSTYHDILKCPPGWRWHFKITVPLSNATEVDIHHSYGANILLQSKKRGRSLIQGHHHTEAGVQWWGSDTDDRFAAFTGCGIDDVALAFAYNRNQVERPRLGAIVVLDGIAYWKPMILDRNGRWNKIVP
jgi:hypothetical protein